MPLAKRSPANPVVDSDATDQKGMKPYTEVIAGADVTFEMLPIPGGKFTMGSPDGEEGRGDDEGPQVEVEIEPFWMGKYEVTWDEYDTWGLKLDIERRKRLRTQEGTDVTNWDKLVDAIARPTNAYTDMTFGMGHDGYPAICMAQYAAKMYCKWLCASTGRYYRLPTEAEWEYACRAGTTTAYSFGDDVDDLDDYAWHFDNSDDQYQKVGEKKPNPWGLYDMHGNVSEWVLDQHVADFYAKHGDGPVKSPLAVPTTEFARVVRGGSWDDDAEALRSATRRASEQDWKMQDPQIPQSIWYLTDANFVGVRVVRPLKTPSGEQCKLYEPDIEIMNEYREAQGGKQ
ncbi:SUMF1/EgtB/PvdO family nonheme iron enzyme [bacterium]|nr:SUMF1/EgtB/PvdO family nonheme iron enzyme [bacterium]